MLRQAEADAHRKVAMQVGLLCLAACCCTMTAFCSERWQPAVLSQHEKERLAHCKWHCTKLTFSISVISVELVLLSVWRSQLLLTDQVADSIVIEACLSAQVLLLTVIPSASCLLQQWMHRSICIQLEEGNLRMPLR